MEKPPQEIHIEENVPVVVGGGTNSKTIGIPQGSVEKFHDAIKAENGGPESLGINTQIVKEPTHQLSTIGWLFFLFGLLFLVAYLVHRAGGPHKVEAAIDHFIVRARHSIMGGKGRYTSVNSGLPR